ncbi:MAG TPA: pyrroloquinoline quinone biosynthesis protein PqqB [Xanthobacteraceae bacterium]|nr:pyrroloquinoline quinone biosynthesis protein PqqB [Xanthobacteraceae bacterium]
MTAIVLGSAAGGGFPQWNCLCAVCRLAWAGDRRVKPRTQASLAVSADGEAWVLLNASPDLRAQLQATPELHPRTPPRGSPIAAVILTGAEVDQTAGLLSLRERQPFALYATAETQAALAINPMLDVLASEVVSRTTVTPGETLALPGGIEAELFTVPGKAPLYLEGDHGAVVREDGSNVGIELRAGGRRLLYVPGAAAVPAPLQDRLKDADVVLFDGTLFTDDEMIVTGTGAKTGLRMGHMPIDGDGGSLAALSGLKRRRIYIHINNTNPILVDGAPERRKVEAAGWEIAEDGLRIAL